MTNAAPAGPAGQSTPEPSAADRGATPRSSAASSGAIPADPGAAAPGVGRGGPGIGPAAGDTVLIPGVGPVRLATIRQRAIARLIDTAILGSVIGVVGAFGILGSLDVTVGGAVGGLNYGRIVFLSLLVTVLGLAYEPWFLVNKGATPGKRITHTQVVDSRTGGRLAWGAATLRYALPWLLGLFCSGLTPLTYISAAWDSGYRRQGYHDKAAESLVIRTD